MWFLANQLQEQNMKSGRLVIEAHIEIFLGAWAACNKSLARAAAGVSAARMCVAKGGASSVGASRSSSAARGFEATQSGRFEGRPSTFQAFFVLFWDYDHLQRLLRQPLLQGLQICRLRHIGGVVVV